MPTAIFARLALTEARRGGLVWLALAAVALGLALGAFLSQVALTESRMLQAAVLGATLAAAFALPALLWAAPAAVLCWGVSLAFELALVAAAALFFAMTLASL